MKIAYLILAHNTPNHLRRLVKALDSQHSGFFIHLDKKSDISDFWGLKAKNINWPDTRIPVFWGDFSQIEAIICLIRQALHASDDYDYFVLLSGSDYPLRSNRYIYEFFGRRQGAEFINIVKMPSKTVNKPVSRLSTYRFQPQNFPDHYTLKVLNKLASFVKRDYKKHLGSIEPYAGSTWWALTRDACTYILKFYVQEESIVKFFRNTISPDEIFFQTILGNSLFKERIKRNLTYTDWSAGGPNPAIICKKHIAFFESQIEVLANDIYGQGELLFARKFSDNSEELVAKINKMISWKNGIG